MENHLIVDSVTVSYGRNKVVKGGYITTSRGKVIGLVGSNGSGKSTIFKALMGGVRAENLSIKIDETPIEKNKINEYVKYLPQGRMIPGGMKISKVFQLYGVNYWVFVNHFPPFTRYHDSYIWDLSGGEAKLLEVGLILLSDSPFCILDEPFTHVDPINIEGLKELIIERKQDRGIIITDHNFDILSSIVDETYIMFNGYTLPIKNQDDLIRYGYLRARDEA